VSEGGTGFTHYTVTDFAPNLLGIALVPGLLALLLYYRALAKTPASLATIAEMAYPVAATLIASGPPPWGFQQPLYPAQVAGTVILIAVIGVLGWTKEKAPPVEQDPVVADTRRELEAV
jgi:drug/metabolite transporter (DMT)-like permease